MNSDLSWTIQQFPAAISSPISNIAEEQPIRPLVPITCSKHYLLMRLRRAVQKLERSFLIKDLNHINNEAKILRTYATRVNLPMKAKNECAELQIRVERKIGEILTETKILQNSSAQCWTLGSQSYSFLLRKLGLSSAQAIQCQMISSLTDYQFEKQIQEIEKSGGKLTSAAMVAYADNVRYQKYRMRKGRNRLKQAKNTLSYPSNDKLNRRFIGCDVDAKTDARP